MIDVREVTDRLIKNQYAGRYDGLEEKDFFELSNADMVKQV